ncbi:MAG: hypothetical protein V2A63_03035 [Patescibacteria group bacterium]
MHSPKSKLAVLALTLLLLFGCGISPNSDSTVEQNSDALAPSGSIELESGTPTVQVEIYKQKAIDAQTRLRLLLENGTPNFSLREKIIPIAFAADAEFESEVTALLNEIEIYTELALDAATSLTDPAEVAALLDSIQSVQKTTSEILARPPETREMRKLFAKTQARLAVRVVDTDEAIAAVYDALDSGATSVEVGVDNEVEDLLPQSRTQLNFAALENIQNLTELKIQLATAELAKVRERIAAGELTAANTDPVLAEIQNQIANATQLLADGKADEAFTLASESKRAVNKIKNVIARSRDALARATGLQKRAEAGDELAAAQLEKLQSFLVNKDLTEILAEQVGQQKERAEKIAAVREDSDKIRREVNQTLLQLKKSELAGEISAAEFAKKETELLAQVRAAQAERIQAEKELRTQQRELLGELTGLSTDDAKVRRAEIQTETEVRMREARSDERKLFDALTTGNAETIQAVQNGIRIKREQASAQQKIKFQRATEQQTSTGENENGEVKENENTENAVEAQIETRTGTRSLQDLGNELQQKIQVAPAPASSGSDSVSEPARRGRN